MSEFYERYMAGGCEPVWDELYMLGPTVRTPRYYEDAVAVAQETMRRVRLNCELLIPRLQALRWRFGYEWARQIPGVSEWVDKYIEEEIASQPPLLGEPTPVATLDNIEAHNGILPISLRSFYAIVGAVNFVGTPFQRPGWPSTGPDFDPLYVAGVAQAFGYRRYEWDEDTRQVRTMDTGDSLVLPWQDFGVEIAPDFLHKYFISGVGSAYIEIPAEGADAPLMFGGAPLQVDGRDFTFVRMLRYMMQSGGFFIFRADKLGATRPDADIAYLTEGLWPI